MWRANSLEKTLMLRKTEGGRRSGQQMRWLNGITDSMDMSISKLQDTVKDSKAWRTAAHRVTKRWTWLSNWTTTIQKQASETEALRISPKVPQLVNYKVKSEIQVFLQKSRVLYTILLWTGDRRILTSQELHEKEVKDENLQRGKFEMMERSEFRLLSLWWASLVAQQ